MAVLLTREIIGRTGWRIVKLFWFIKSCQSSQPDACFSLGKKSTCTDMGFKTPQKGSTRPAYSWPVSRFTAKLDDPTPWHPLGRENGFLHCPLTSMESLQHARHTHRHTNCNTEQETTYSVVDWRWQGQTVEWEALWEGRVESSRYWPNPEVLLSSN